MEPALIVIKNCIMKHPVDNKVLMLIFSLVLALTSCAPTRKPIPIGLIPKEEPLKQADITYGRRVLDELNKQFPISNNRADYQRVKQIVDRLTTETRTNREPWFLYVLNADSVVNAGATRGNHIFVWSGLLRALPNDSDLASVLSHEIAHVLAHHPRENPAETINSALSNAAGVTTRAIIDTTHGNSAAPYGAIAQAVVTEAMKGFIVNPESQRQELEADRIGLFIMAESGYRPEEVVDFWYAAQYDPNFANSDFLPFLSSHPSSKNRLRELKRILPLAKDRYYKTNSYHNPHNKRSKSNTPSPQPLHRHANERYVYNPPFLRGHNALNSRHPLNITTTQWEASRPRVPVYAQPFKDYKLSLRDELKLREKVAVVCRFEKFLRVIHPVKGYVEASDLKPRNRSIAFNKLENCRN
jgi:predicted Zn-dependent protease